MWGGGRLKCFKAFCPRRLHYVTDSSAMMALSLKKPKEIKHPRLEATHVAPFISYFPSLNILPQTFPFCWCISFLPSSLVLSLSLCLTPALHLIDSTTECLWQMIGICEWDGGEGRQKPEPRLWSGRFRATPAPSVSLCPFWAFWTSPKISRLAVWQTLLLSHSDASTHNWNQTSPCTRSRITFFLFLPKRAPHKRWNRRCLQHVGGIWFPFSALHGRGVRRTLGQTGSSYRTLK